MHLEDVKSQRLTGSRPVSEAGGAGMSQTFGAGWPAPVSRCHLSPQFPNIDKAWAVLPLGCLHVGDPYLPTPCSSPMDGTVPPPPILPLWPLILLLVGTQESPESEAQRG